MNILFALDPADGIDPDDPIGDITLTNGQTTLSIESTYLDSWFETLINGFKSLQINQKITLEIPEEPELIIFEPIVEGFKISYGKKALFFQSLNEFLQPLLLAAQEFLAQLDQNSRQKDSFPNLVNLRQFIEQSAEQRSQKLTRTALT